MARVTFEGNRYPLQDNESVLKALLRGGASVAFSCRKGSCYTCMLRARSGDPGFESQKNLRQSLRDNGYFLPCKSIPQTDLEVERPDLRHVAVRMHVSDKKELAPGIFQIILDPETNFNYRPGQYVNIIHPTGIVRSYSIASSPEETTSIELHVQRKSGGAVSTWLCDEIQLSDVLEVQGPFGSCSWDQHQNNVPHLFVATGTGLSPLLGVLREALLHAESAQGAPLWVYHGGRTMASLYCHELLSSYAKKYPRLKYYGCVSSENAHDGAIMGRALDVAFDRHPDLSQFRVFVAGAPEITHEARYRAVQNRADRNNIIADPFEHTPDFMPDDVAKLQRIAPDLEMWAALKNGDGLIEILEDFYGRVYQDERLAPFFHKVTKKRAIEKQYAFLADVFTGKHDYFGLKPFNAHHWMVISDELFDYRERLFDECVQRYGLAPDLHQKWKAIHELFRRELVKQTPRGLIIDGVEHVHRDWDEDVLQLASICDGCQNEVFAGENVRVQRRTGELFCAKCTAKKAGATIPPTATTLPGTRQILAQVINELTSI